MISFEYLFVVHVKENISAVWPKVRNLQTALLEHKHGLTSCEFVCSFVESFFFVAPFKNVHY